MSNGDHMGVNSVKYLYKVLPALLFTFVLLLTLSSCDEILFSEDDNGYRLPTPDYPVPYEDPSWSNDGNTIVFHRMKVTSVGSIGNFSIDNDSTGIWAINADGTNMRLLIQGTRLGNPELSPDGNWLVFNSGNQIYKANLLNEKIDPSNIIQLTTEGKNYSPSWSPDGEWIAYDSNVNSPVGGYSIWKMNSDGSNKERFARGRMADWSPDGNYIIYRGLHSEIYRMNVNDTSEVDRLTSLNQIDVYATDNRYPEYSYDGEKIAFSSPLQIWTMNSDGTNLEQITNENSSNHPSWSPDGKIVYVHVVFGKRDYNNGTLWVMDADGSNNYQLTFNHGLSFDTQE